MNERIGIVSENDMAYILSMLDNNVDFDSDTLYHTLLTIINCFDLDPDEVLYGAVAEYFFYWRDINRIEQSLMMSI
jgi:hypothetical protein